MKVLPVKGLGLLIFLGVHSVHARHSLRRNDAADDPKREEEEPEYEHHPVAALDRPEAKVDQQKDVQNERQDTDSCVSGGAHGEKQGDIRPSRGRPSLAPRYVPRPHRADLDADGLDDADRLVAHAPAGVILLQEQS